MVILQGVIPPKTYANLCVRPHARCTIKKSQRFRSPYRGRKGNIMRLQVQNQIRSLALQGFGYKRIADIVGLSPDTVKSHLRRHPAKPEYSVCMQCGKPLEQTKGRKEKKFCSDKCRMAFWNSHQDEVNKQAYYNLICLHCGKEFESYGNKNRKYCSRVCYAEARRKSA